LLACPARSDRPPGGAARAEEMPFDVVFDASARVHPMNET